MKEKICVFAGTTEGRALAEGLCERYDLTVCVATEFGREALEGVPGIEVKVGRMDDKEMEAFFRERGFSRVIDATHPYAEIVTENIRMAAKRADVEVLRVLRESGEAEGTVWVGSAAEAGRYLAGTEGAVLVTTGAKELGELGGLDMARVWVRVLPTAESIDACNAAGVAAGHIIAMRGPFSREMNVATMRQMGARWLVTKCAGAAGGFEEKIAAARELHVTPVVIGRPPEAEGVSLGEALRLLLPPEKVVTIVGIGPGGEGLLTGQARRAIDGCDGIIGAGSVLERVNAPGREKIAAFMPEDVRAAIESRGLTKPVVAVRGDVGFYSGAEGIRRALSDYRVSVVPGIASPVYFASQLGISWDGVKLMSLHGREGNVVRAAAENGLLMVLTGGESSPAAVCRSLTEFGLGELAVTVGERLSYPDERLSRGAAREMTAKEFDRLSILLIENPGARRRVRRGIPDGEFIRGDVPMTKAEVRAVCLSALSPEWDSVIWDVGAGTGSVSVECALSAPEGRVFAVERSRQGCELIRRNAVKFCADNIEVVEGEAPEALEGLPAPTHVFIGGASGRMREILDIAFGKNPRVRVVATAVTLETQAELTELCGEGRYGSFEAVTVSAARSKHLGRHTMMLAQNPVTVFTVRGGGEDG